MTRWREDGRSQRVWRTSGKHGTRKKLSRAHMGSQRLKQQGWGLHGSAPTRSSSYVMAISSVLFGDSWQRHWVCLWHFWCCFAFFGGCLVQPPNESFHLALLYLDFSVCLSPLGGLLISKEEWFSGIREVRGKLGGVEGDKTVVALYSIREESIFNKKSEFSLFLYLHWLMFYFCVFSLALKIIKLFSSKSFNF